MARITAGITTSHVPAIGAAIDLGKTKDPYWTPAFAGFDFSKQWIAEHMPDVVLLVYNDHATAFNLDFVPTFAIGCAASYAPADEGWGRARPGRRRPSGARLAHRAIRDPAGLRPHGLQPL
jgi:protocatechuate 4,5-dioxygenase beta chain